MCASACVCVCICVCVFVASGSITSVFIRLGEPRRVGRGEMQALKRRRLCGKQATPPAFDAGRPE